MRSSLAFPVLLAALLAVPAALAVGAGVEQFEQELDSGEVTCADALTCDAPVLKVRLEAGGVAVDMAEPDKRCVNRIVDDGESTDPACQPQPNVDPGVLRLYAKVDGLEAPGLTAADEEQGAPVAPAPGEHMSTGMQAAIVAGALGLGASGAIAAFGLRRFVTLLLAPLAARLEPSRLLDDDTRQRIYETVRDDPGINLRGLADRLDLAWGTLLHHLHKLEKANLVVSRRYGKYRRYFVNGSTYSREEQARLAALSTPSTARVAEFILENPGSTQAEVGEALGVTPSTVLFHARRLKEVGLVDAVREGRYVKYFPQITHHERSQMAVA